MTRGGPDPDPAPEGRLAAALRAQAAGMAAGFPPGRGAQPATGDDERPGNRLSGWTVLALAVLLGALAGGLAGAISAW